MATVSSTSYTAEAAVSSSDIAAPSGLSEGDVLIAVITENGGEPKLPIGWTNLFTTDATSGSNRYVSFMGKIVTASDALAANFTFEPSSGTPLIGGALLRLTDAAQDLSKYAVDSVVDSNNNSEGNVNKTVSMTPVNTNSAALVYMLASSLDNQVSIEITSLSGTTNPTWTEVMEQSFGSNGLYNLSYGTLSTADTVTAINADIEDRQSNTDDFRVVLAFADAVDASGTNTLVTASTETFTQTGSNNATGTNVLISASAETFTQTGLGADATAWTTVNKS